MLISKDKKPFLLSVLLFALITTIIVFSWFRYGFVYGGGDVGLPGYNPQRILEITQHIWWESSAPGTTVPQGLTSVPFQFVQSILQNTGLPFVIIQATFFGIILFLMGFGMFLLGIQVFGRNKLYLAILAGLFYMLNPYMMVQVWHRFIHNTFFLVASLPFMFIFFRGWIREGKYSSLLFFILTNFMAVYLFGTIAFIVTILTFFLFIISFEIIFPWKGFTQSKPVLARSFLGILAWTAIHSWWLLPVLNVYPAVLLSQHSVTDNLSTLLSISSQTIIPYTLLGINPFYLYTQADFGRIFDNYFFRFLPWLTLLFLVPGFIVALRNKTWTFWALLALAGIFLSKGATSPFGYLYIFGFSNSFPLGVLRNPFEKMGILIIFSYAILLPLGIEWYLKNSKEKNKLSVKISIAIILFLILGINLWPMWLGVMFGKINKLAFIQIPDSYTKADEYIRTQNEENPPNKGGKILHLPLTLNESVNYNWKYGYTGVEPSQLLFKSMPSISHGFNLDIVDNALNALAYNFILQDSKDKTLALLRSFNVKFIILHKDIDWYGGYLPQPEKLENLLKKLNFLEKKIQFGDLIIYELRNEYFNPIIKIVNNIDYISPSENTGYWPWLLSSSEADLLSIKDDNTKDVLLKNANNLIVSSEHTYKYIPEKIIKENLLGEMPAAKILPDSPLYLFIRLKEKLQFFNLPVFNKFSFKVTIAGKRLTESYLLKEKGSKRSIIPGLKEYLKLLPELKEETIARSNGNEGKGEISINFILARHHAMLNIIREKGNEQERRVVDEVVSQLNNLMKEASIIPYFQTIETNDLQVSNRLISRFNLPKSGKYEFLQAHEQSQNIYPDSLSNQVFQINNETKKLKGVITDNFISYGMFDLTAGLNEISFNSIPSINLAKLDDGLIKGQVKKNNDEIEISSSVHEPSYLEINVEPIHGGSWYQLNFESWIILGDKIKVNIISDTDSYDPENSTEKIPSYYNDYTRDPYRNHWNGTTFNFYIKPATSKTKIVFLVSPWDGCRFYQQIKSLCLGKQIKYQYEKPSQTIIKNIKVFRLLNNPIFLRTALQAKTKDDSNSKVIFTQKSAIFYSGKINLSSPGFLIFSETFHPGWELELSNGEKIIPSKKFISNLYGNAWYIEKGGDYNFKLEFTPEKNVTIGIIVSLTAFLIVGVLFINQKIKE